MDDKQQIIELYKEFMYTKENFVSRSFATNKFYIVAITLCFVIMAALKEFNVVDGSLTVVAIAIAGFAFSLLLWANQDAYSYLLRIKFSSVIDKMEESFSFQPCIEEKKALIENAKKKKNFVFANIQKTFALVTMAIFLATFVYDFLQYFVNNINSLNL
ncbi:hypothetical protein IJS77_03795 [bacterium]|nr:hypothetical protein [bacterium]